MDWIENFAVTVAGTMQKKERWQYQQQQKNKMIETCFYKSNRKEKPVTWSLKLKRKILDFS